MTLREQIARDEGLRLKAYKDAVGKTTVGYGRNLDDTGISIAEADLMLANDLTRASADVLTHLPWATGLGEVRLAVLVNMSFNLGIGGLMEFTRMLRHCQAGEWTQASNEMLDSKWAGQVGIRSERLAQQMVTGEWT